MPSPSTRFERTEFVENARLFSGYGGDVFTRADFVRTAERLAGEVDVLLERVATLEEEKKDLGDERDELQAQVEKLETEVAKREEQEQKEAK